MTTPVLIKTACILSAILLLSSCVTTYDYFHSAHGSDFKPLTSHFKKDTLVLGLEGGILKGYGFNNTNDAGLSDQITYGWGQFSGTKNTKYIDIGLGIQGYYGQFKDHRPEIEINQNADNPYSIPNPFSGQSRISGFTGSVDFRSIALGL